MNRSDLLKNKNTYKANKGFFDFLRKKSLYVRRETLKIHKIAPDTRIASSLSSVEIFVALYYGKILDFNSKNPASEKRDRLIISKGHGAICLYPILADLGFFDSKELTRVCKQGSFLGAIPDTLIPGFETINGSLGHGLGVACGIALALKLKKDKHKVFVVLGDGELYEGAVWEAIMFAGYHKLDNIVLIIDNNKICMLDYCHKILDLRPQQEKFKAFGWNARDVDGHDVVKLQQALIKLKNTCSQVPQVLFAQTIKGKGAPKLETDQLCHVKSLTGAEVDCLVEELK